MNVHWLAPTQTPRNPAFLQYHLEPHHSCFVHSWGLGSTAAHPWVALALSKALELTGEHWGTSGTVLQPWATGNSTSTVPGGAFWELCHTQSWEQEHPARDHLCVPEAGYEFSCTSPSERVPPFSRHAGWQTSCHTNTFWDCIFHHNYSKLEMCTCPVDIAAPKLSGFSSYLPASSTALTSSHLAHSGFLKFEPQRPSYPSPSPSGYTKMAFKNQEKTCSEYRLTNPHYLTQDKAGLRQGRLTWRLK